MARKKKSESDQPQQHAEETTEEAVEPEQPVELPQPDEASLDDQAEPGSAGSDAGEEKPLSERDSAPQSTDIAPETEAESEPLPNPLVTVPEPRRRGGIGMFLSGATVALAGFGLSHYATNGGWPFAPAQIDSVKAAQTSTEAALDALSEQVAAIEPKLDAMALRSDVDLAMAAAQTAQDQLAALTAVVGPIKAQQADILASIEELRQRPVAVEGSGPSAEAVAAYERELAAMRSSLDAELARIREAANAAADERVAAAEATARAATAGLDARAAGIVAELRAAVDSGAALSGLAEQLAQIDPSLPVGGLSGFSEGAPTMTALRESFPAAARAALAADNLASGASDTTGNLWGFVKAQLGMRSLSPKDGNSVDAILSRAEANVQSGDLAAALTELTALPDHAKTAMSDWVTSANTRLSALSAVDAVAQAVLKQ